MATAKIPDGLSQANQAGRPAAITARYDRANTGVKRQQQAQHYKRLCSAIRDIVVNDASGVLLREVAARAIKDGLPVDSHALFADARMLAHEARYICLAIPGLSSIHKEARTWLAWKERRDASGIEGSVPWNMVCGGVAINKEGD